MKVVHATWERRNLGVDCREITVESGDGVDDMVQALLEHSTEYTVLRVPVARVDVLFKAQDLGFRFIETMTYCYQEGLPLRLNSVQQRVIDRVSWQRLDEAGVADVLVRVRRGMFDTDRVSLDPRFGLERSAERYVHWIRDELGRGGRLFRMLYGDREFGFFTLRRQGDDVDVACLNGIYEEFRTSGFGFACHYCEVVESVRSGARRVMVAYSSNNRGAAAVHQSMGHVLVQQLYVLVKHHADT